jgi:hypothetical protein
MSREINQRAAGADTTNWQLKNREEQSEVVLTQHESGIFLLALLSTADAPKSEPLACMQPNSADYHWGNGGRALFTKDRQDIYSESVFFLRA